MMVLTISICNYDNKSISYQYINEPISVQPIVMSLYC